MADSLRKIKTTLAQETAAQLAPSENRHQREGQREERYPTHQSKKKMNPMVIMTIVVIILAILAALMGFRLLKAFTHDNEIDMPVLTDMTLEEATQIATEAGLSVTSVRKYTDEAPKA